MNVDRAPVRRSASLRALVLPVLGAAALMAVLAVWIRAEPVDVGRALQIALGAVPAALFGAVVWYAHRADA